MGILEETVSIVREAERLVIGPRVNSRWASVDTTLDAVVNMPWFLLAGVQERLATLGFGLLLVPVWWCILTTIMWVTGGGSPASFHSSDGWIVATLMAAGSVIFRLPSRSARLGVRSPQVVRLAAHINAVAADETTIKLLQSGVSALDSAANQRITRINWCLGIGWADAPPLSVAERIRVRGLL